jgi:hypothetical protein
VSDEELAFIYNGQSVPSTTSHATRRESKLNKTSVPSSSYRQPTSQQPGNLNQKMRSLLEDLDARRIEHLSNSKHEGIVFLTHEIDSVCLEHFELEDFPYDVQSLTIKVRLEKPFDDPLYRHIVPLCLDKVYI